MRESVPTSDQLSPPSSERYSPDFPSRASINAYTRRLSDRAIAIPTLPHSPAGNPLPLICFQVRPPSADLYNPLPGPPIGGYVLHGGRRICHSAAKTICGLAGSIVTSTAPVFSSLYKTFCQVAPPSAERKTPRSVLGP